MYTGTADPKSQTRVPFWPEDATTRNRLFKYTLAGVKRYRIQVTNRDQKKQIKQNKTNVLFVPIYLQRMRPFFEALLRSSSAVHVSWRPRTLASSHACLQFHRKSNFEIIKKNKKQSYFYQPTHLRRTNALINEPRADTPGRGY